MSRNNTARQHKTAGQTVYFEHFEDVSRILKDRRFGSPQPPTGLLRVLRYAGFGKLVDAVESGFFSLLNPPEHGRLRKIVEPFFNRPAVESLEPKIEAILKVVLDTVGSKSEFDLVSEVAAQLPARVISEIFGFPEKDVERLNNWAHSLAPLGDQELHRSALIPGLVAFGRFRRLLLQQVRERKHNPRDDLISALAQAHYGSPGISTAEVVGVSVLVFTAGQTTIMHLIGSCVHRLLQNPEAVAQVSKQPQSFERLVEEVLRIQSPLQRVTRVALEDVEINGLLITRGTAVRLMIGAANRDPVRFNEPERFDIDRPNAHHLAFAAGNHFCFGLHLARLEAKVAVAEIFRRFPDLTVVNNEEVWRKGTKFHGLSALHVRVSK